MIIIIIIKTPWTSFLFTTLCSKWNIRFSAGSSWIPKQRNFCMDGYCSCEKKTNGGQITCIIKRNEKNNRILKMNEKKRRVWNRLNILEKTIVFLLNGRFFGTNFLKKFLRRANCYLFVQTQCAAVRMCFLVTKDKMIKTNNNDSYQLYIFHIFIIHNEKITCKALKLKNCK